MNKIKELLICSILGVGVVSAVTGIALLINFLDSQFPEIAFAVVLAILSLLSSALVYVSRNQ
jgi:hypothetical protein